MKACDVAVVVGTGGQVVAWQDRSTPNGDNAVFETETIWYPDEFLARVWHYKGPEDSGVTFVNEVPPEVIAYHADRCEENGVTK